MTELESQHALEVGIHVALMEENNFLWVSLTEEGKKGIYQAISTISTTGTMLI